MEKTEKLNEAFYNFTLASKSLETYYLKLSRQVEYLTRELEERNDQLKDAVYEAQESREYLNAVLLNIGETIIVLDRNGKVAMINRAAEELLGFSSSDVSGTLFEDLDMNIEKEHSGTVLHVKDRKYDVMFSRSVVPDSDGSVRGHVIMIKDISWMKELERQNERNQRLISMGEMAAKIVHEIRSPLCSIELYASMLSGDLKGTTHSEMADGISTGIKSLNNILTNMLYFARQQKPAFKKVKLSTVIDESIRVLVPLIEIRGIKYSRNINDETVNGDSELLKQVFMNILLNAIQSMPEGGSMKVESARNDGFVSVLVTDEGPGIAPDIIEKIFNPFFSTKDKGTGLGLAIAHKIIQCHDGFIKAFNNPDTGSTFSICFPVRKQSAWSEIDEDRELIAQHSVRAI